MTAIVLRGDARSLPLPDASVDLICTSPPYWKQRDYRDGGKSLAFQIGREETPAEYIAALLACTRECARILKPEGSLFVNLGDKYGNAKSLLGLPWRYVIGCMDDLRLTLRAEIIWDKPNGLPESVTDRVRRSHEQVFHFTRSPRYFTAVDEIREPVQTDHHSLSRRDRTDRRLTAANGGQVSAANPLGKLPGSVWEIAPVPLVLPEWLNVEHFAAYPPELCRRIILGWSPAGICTACGEGRRPAVSSVALDMGRPQARRAQQLADRAGLTEEHLRALLSVGISDTGRGAATQSGTGKNTPEVYALAAEARAALGGYAREYLLRRPAGFSYACACPQPDAPTRPAVVVDPFGGTGTTALVADVLGRTGISIDGGMDYSRAARWRTRDPGERARALGVPKPPPVSEAQGSLFDEPAA